MPNRDVAAQPATSGIATGGVKVGQSAPLTAKNLPKIGKTEKKRRENQDKEEKSGRFFHFVPPDR